MGVRHGGRGHLAASGGQQQQQAARTGGGKSSSASATLVLQGNEDMRGGRGGGGGRGGRGGGGGGGGGEDGEDVLTQVVGISTESSSFKMLTIAVKNLSFLFFFEALLLRSSYF